jgi:uncharacterized membrane protein
MKWRPRPYQWFSLVIVVLCFAVATWAYPLLPGQVASHWNAAGEVDGYMSKFWGTYLMPIIAAALWPLVVFLPIADPRSQNIDKFRLEYDRMIFGLFLFLAVVFGLTLAWNFGIQYNMSQAIVPAIGVLFIMVGRMVMKSEPNFTAGIRTPWTLSSDTVWRKTHDLGGKLFVGAGVLSLAGLLLPDLAVWLVLISTFAVVGITIPYSYYLYRQEQGSATSDGPTEPGQTL